VIFRGRGGLWLWEGSEVPGEMGSEVPGEMGSEVPRERHRDTEKVRDSERFICVPSELLNAVSNEELRCWVGRRIYTGSWSHS
jgi:hypothetical protein